MIESVIGSLASSMELAKSFLSESQGVEETEREVEEGGVEAFAKVIDAVMSRMRLVFVDTVVRLENPPRPDSTLSTAVELQIDRFVSFLFHFCRSRSVAPTLIAFHHDSFMRDCEILLKNS